MRNPIIIELKQTLLPLRQFSFFPTSAALYCYRNYFEKKSDSELELRDRSMQKFAFPVGFIQVSSSVYELDSNQLSR